MLEQEIHDHVFNSIVNLGSNFRGPIAGDEIEFTQEEKDKLAAEMADSKFEDNSDSGSELNK